MCARIKLSASSAFVHNPVNVNSFMNCQWCYLGKVVFLRTYGTHEVCRWWLCVVRVRSLFGQHDRCRLLIWHRHRSTFKNFISFPNILKHCRSSRFGFLIILQIVSAILSIDSTARTMLLYIIIGNPQAHSYHWWCPTVCLYLNVYSAASTWLLTLWSNFVLESRAGRRS